MMIATPRYRTSPLLSHYLSRCRHGLAARLLKLERDMQAAAASLEKNTHALRLVAELTGLQQKIARVGGFSEASGLCPACFIDRESSVKLQAGSAEERDPGRDPHALHCGRCNSTFSAT